MDQATGSEPFIEVRSISRSYTDAGHKHWVLKNVTLSTARGERVALLGRSGSGKSTLLNIISGIDKPDSGSVVVGGRELTALNERQRTLFRRRHIGFIYQFFNLVPTLTARENVAFVLELNGYSAGETEDRVETMLDALGISDKGRLFPSQLSGGEQQRVAVARALIHAPRLVLADEPTGNLDAKTGKNMLGVLNKLLAETASSLLLVTHSLEVARTADRIVTLDDGVLTEQGSELAW